MQNIRCAQKQFFYYQLKLFLDTFTYLYPITMKTEVVLLRASFTVTLTETKLFHNSPHVSRVELIQSQQT